MTSLLPLVSEWWPLRCSRLDIGQNRSCLWTFGGPKFGDIGVSKSRGPNIDSK